MTPKKPFIASVAMIVAGFGIQINVHTKIAEIASGCVIFVGLIMFALSLYFFLEKTK
jgi:hypothetical protein